MELPGVDLLALLAALAPRPVTVVRDGDDFVVATCPDDVVVANGDAAFGVLDRAERGGFWVGFLAYDLGHAVEHIDARIVDDLHTPDLVLTRHDTRVVWSAGAPPRVVGDGPARPVLEQALEDATCGKCAWETSATPSHARWRSSLGRDEHTAHVHAIKELLLDGQCYQVNLTRRLTLDERVDPVALYTAVMRRHHAPHAALLTFDERAPGIAVVSASPELFLRTAGRWAETRPIKGTARDAAPLRASEKDRAENVMIVDLARNDFGRVCVPGSITVPALCAVEQHPGLHHLVSTVRGRRRDDVSLGTLMRAVFPPASVTGAPKPRVVQAIEDLEPVRRGVYCGAVGWVDGDHDRSEWAVAIRTFQMTDDETHFGVGGGIVADSDAAGEWQETELKASRLLDLVPVHAPVHGATLGPGAEHAVIIWLDGALVPLAATRISPLDHGLVVGDGVFETLRVYNGVPFAWRRHYERLVTSGEGLGLAVPGTTELRRAADDVLNANEFRDARLRITVTGGPTPPGVEPRDAKPTVLVVRTPVAAPDQPAATVIVPWSRNEGGTCAGLKTISYAENVRALAYAEARDAHEAIFANTRGELCEATGSNVFVVRDGVAFTPPASAGCLLGVTRGLLLECSGVEEAVLGLDDLRGAEEAFLTSTVREVQPIASVNGRRLALAPGPVTEKLAAALRQLVGRDLDP